MDKYTIAPPSGSTNNSIGAADRPWNEGHFDALKLGGGDLGTYLAESNGYGIVSGCEPSISGLTVTVAAGVVHLAGGTRKEISATNITLDAADSTYGRVDIIYIDSNGVVQKSTGVPASDASPNILPDGYIGVCLVEVNANDTTGTITVKEDSSLVDNYTWKPRFRRTNLSCVGQQDADYYDGKLFTFATDAGTMVVYDVAINNTLATSTLAGGAKPHCNTACFGLKKQASDTYPLIYLTGYNGKDSNNSNLPLGTCFVYKINSDFTTEFVQQISIGFTADDLWLVGTGKNPVGIGAINYGNFIVDTDRKRLIVFTCTHTNPCTRVFEFAIPSTDVSSVTLQTTDIIEYWDIPLLPWPQGSKYKDGKLYASHGLEEKTSAVDVLDISTKSLISHISMGDFTEEAEGIFFIENCLYVKGTNKYHEVINYKKLSSIGNLSLLNTISSNSIVDAINSANTKGISLKTRMRGPAGTIKFIPITVVADENEDLYNPIKNAILNARYNDNGTMIYYFSGIATKHNGTVFQKINGFYRISDGLMYFSRYHFTNENQKVSYEYDGAGNLVEVLHVYSSKNVENCLTREYAMLGNETKYFTVKNTIVSIMVHGLYGLSNIMRQYIAGVSNFSAYKFDSNNDNLVTLTALGNGKFSITTGDSVRIRINASDYITVTSS